MAPQECTERVPSDFLIPRPRHGVFVNLHQLTTAPSPISHLSSYIHSGSPRLHSSQLSESAVSFPFPRHSFSGFPSYVQVTTSCHLQKSGGSRRLKGRGLLSRQHG